MPSVAWVLHCGVRRNRQKNVEISSVASQLSVSLPGDQSKLNGKHVVLGRVVQGMEAPWKAMESTKGKGPSWIIWDHLDTIWTLWTNCYTVWWCLVREMVKRFTRKIRKSCNMLQPSSKHSKLVNGTTQALNIPQPWRFEKKWKKWLKILGWWVWKSLLWWSVWRFRNFFHFHLGWPIQMTGCLGQVTTTSHMIFEVNMPVLLNLLNIPAFLFEILLKSTSNPIEIPMAEMFFWVGRQVIDRVELETGTEAESKPLKPVAPLTSARWVCST